MKRVSKTNLLSGAVLAVFLVLLFAFAPAKNRMWQAQETLSADTVAKSTTTNFVLSDPVSVRGLPVVSVQIEVTQVSGTASGTVYLDQTNDVGTVPQWSEFDSYAFSGTSDTVLVVNPFTGYNIRARAVTDTFTQSTSFDIHYMIANTSRDQ